MNPKTLGNLPSPVSTYTFCPHVKKYAMSWMLMANALQALTIYSLTIRKERDMSSGGHCSRSWRPVRPCQRLAAALSRQGDDWNDSGARQAPMQEPEATGPAVPSPRERAEGPAWRAQPSPRPPAARSLRRKTKVKTRNQVFPVRLASQRTEPPGPLTLFTRITVIAGGAGKVQPYHSGRWEKKQTDQSCLTDTQRTACSCFGCLSRSTHVYFKEKMREKWEK